MSTPQEKALFLLHSRQLKRFYARLMQRYRVRITVSDDLTDEAIFAICIKLATNVITSAWRAKLVTKYVIEMLDFEPVIEALRAWRKPNNVTILHEACKSCSYNTIEQLVKKMGDLVHERDAHGNYPINFLLTNQNPETPFYIGRLLNLLSTNDLTPLILFKDTIIKMLCNQPSSSRTPRLRTMMINALDTFASHDLFSEEDRQNILTSMQPLSYRVSNICSVKFRAIKVMKITPEDLDKLYRTVFSQKGVVSYLLDGRPSFLDYLLRNKATNNNQPIDSFEELIFLEKVLAKLPQEPYVPLFLVALRLYAPTGFNSLGKRLETRNKSTLQLIGQLLKHLKDLPKSYVPLLAPFKESWRDNKLQSKEVTITFPFEELPAELISHVISFLPLQSTIAFLLVNKEYEAMINIEKTWRRLTERYFPNVVPLGITTDNHPRRFFHSLRYTKTGPQLRYRSQMYISAPHPGGFVSLELKDDSLVYCSTHQLGLYNMTSYKTIVTPVSKPSSARLFDDIIFVYTSDSISLLGKEDLVMHRCFETSVPATIKDTFAVDSNWLVTPRCVYDWHTGQLMSTWDHRLEQVTLRDNVFYGLSANSLVINDVRESTNVVGKVDVDLASMGAVSLNAHGNFVYLAGNRIETYDVRYPRLMTAFPFATEIDESKVIDLVSMNVWTSGVAWDLCDNTWWSLPTSAHPQPLGDLAVCNGEYIVYSVRNSLVRIRLLSNVRSPYGDYKSQYLSSPYRGYDYTY